MITLAIDQLEVLGRGLYRRADGATLVDPDLLEIAYRAPVPTLRLRTRINLGWAATRGCGGCSGSAG
jgi:hypothetical protein